MKASLKINSMQLAKRPKKKQAPLKAMHAAIRAANAALLPATLERCVPEGIEGSLLATHTATEAAATRANVHKSRRPVRTWSTVRQQIEGPGYNKE